MPNTTVIDRILSGVAILKRRIPQGTQAIASDENGRVSLHLNSLARWPLTRREQARLRQLGWSTNQLGTWVFQIV